MSAILDPYGRQASTLPIVGKRVKNACAFMFAIDPSTVNQSLDALAAMNAENKGEVMIVFGDRYKMLSLDDFLTRIFTEPTEAEAATGGKENEASSNVPA